MKAALPITGRGGAHQKSPSWFSRIAATTAAWTGSPMAFLLAAGTVIVWTVTGPIFGFSDTWQLVINTGTTIVTFLMVFLIQNTQNRESKALQTKLDELITSLNAASNEMVGIEDDADEKLDEAHARVKDRARE